MLKGRRYSENDIYKFYSNMNESMEIFGGLYIDFDNFWNSILDLVTEIRKRDEKDKNIMNNIENKFNEILDNLLSNLKQKNLEIKFIKAYADFNNLPYSNVINIIDMLHKKGIKTIHPYVRGNKDMSDRALIIGVIDDLFFNENVDSIFILTGDIDYLPLFDFISSKTEKEFFLISFENRFNNAYKEIFYLENKIVFLDEILSISSKSLECEKKLDIFKEFLETKKLDINKGINYKETMNNLNSYYYCKFDEKLIKELIKKLKNSKLN